MSTHTATAQVTADPFDDPIMWVWDVLVHALSVFVTAVLLGGLLYYAWGPLAGVFSFLRPIGGFWNCTLVVLGAYGAYSIYTAARDGVRLNVLDMFGDAAARKQLLDAAASPGMILLIAWIIVEFIK